MAFLAESGGTKFLRLDRIVGGGLAEWIYVTPDPPEAVLGPAYFAGDGARGLEPASRIRVIRCIDRRDLATMLESYTLIVTGRDGHAAEVASEDELKPPLRRRLSRSAEYQDA